MEEITDNSIMAFGQYKGTAIANIPASYLLFLFRNEKAGRYKQYILEHFEQLEKEASKNSRKGSGR